jgi:hypothetical protein
MPSAIDVFREQRRPPNTFTRVCRRFQHFSTECAGRSTRWR